MLRRLHLMRHGEVHNPHGVVYADLSGFGLSDTGRAQAAEAARRIAARGADVVLTSPLQRSVETAEIVGAAVGVSPTVDSALTEWALARRWAGKPWPEIDAAERRAYAEHPDRLSFSPEPLGEVVARMAGVVQRLDRSHAGGTAVLVSHQDPVAALRLHLLGSPLRQMMRAKPSHCEVISFEAVGATRREAGRWQPSQPATPFPPRDA